jgi:hypothetical protein
VSATLFVIVMAMQAATPGAPTPQPTVNQPSRMSVRAFLNGLTWKAYDQLAPRLQSQATLVTWDETELVGSDAIANWFRTEFAKDSCWPLVRTDAGHLEDNSIYLGQDDGLMLEYQPVGCSKSRFGNPQDGTKSRMMALRFSTTLSGYISRVEVLK